jgi:hypothetical protein
MPFCTSCGKEVPPGKKFCEYCGTPLEQPAAAPSSPAPLHAVSAAPFPFQEAPIKPAGGSGKTLVVAGIIVVFAIVAGVYFIGLPLLSGSQGTGSGFPPVTTIPTQVPPAVLTTRPPETTPAPITTGIPGVGLTYEEKYTETYNQVYSDNREFIGGQKVIFTQDLTIPPLYIKFNITPKMFYEERPVEIGLSSEHIANISYPSQNAWFKVLVYDADNGGLVEEQGFNKEYSVMTKQEFMIRKPGNYRVEMSGNEVIAEVRILSGKS